jgi:hypothetical protein
MTSKRRSQCDEFIWNDLWYGNGLCSLHAASAVRSESLERSELEPIERTTVRPKR